MLQMVLLWSMFSIISVKINVVMGVWSSNEATNSEAHMPHQRTWVQYLPLAPDPSFLITQTLRNSAVALSCLFPATHVRGLDWDPDFGYLAVVFETVPGLAGFSLSNSFSKESINRRVLDIDTLIILRSW